MTRWSTAERVALTFKLLFTIALVVFLAGPQIVRLVRDVRDALGARVRVGQQSIVFREEGVRLRYRSVVGWSLGLGWTTVDAVIGRRDAYLFTRPLFGIVPRPVYRLVRSEDERDPSAPGIALELTSVAVERGRVVLRARGWRGVENVVVRLASRAPEALTRSLRPRL